MSECASCVWRDIQIDQLKSEVRFLQRQLEKAKWGLKMTEQDKRFYLAWTKALETYGRDAKITDVWAFSEELEKNLEQE